MASLPVLVSPASARDAIAGGGKGFAAQVQSPQSRTLSAVRTGQLKIAKTFQTNGYTGAPSFGITYQCAGKSGTVSLKPGGSTTITSVPAGTCKVTEKALTNPSGWTYATPTYSPAQTAVVTAGKTTTVTVNNAITRNTGSLQIAKTFQTNGYAGDPAFEIAYQCAGKFGTVLLKGGGTATIPGVPPGTARSPRSRWAIRPAGCTPPPPSAPPAPSRWSPGRPPR